MPDDHFDALKAFYGHAAFRGSDQPGGMADPGGDAPKAGKMSDTRGPDLHSPPRPAIKS